MVSRVYLKAGDLRAFSKPVEEGYREKIAEGWNPNQPLVMSVSPNRCAVIEQGNHRLAAAIEHYPDMWIPTLIVFSPKMEDIRPYIFAADKPMDWHFPPPPDSCHSPHNGE